MNRIKALLSAPVASIGNPAKRAQTPATMLGALGLAALVLGQSAHAAQTTAPFQRYINQPCALSVCTLQFNVVAAGTRLDIDNVSCYLKTTGEMDYVQLLAAGPSTIVGAATLVPHFVGASPTSEYSFAANNTVSMTARAGQAFRIFAGTVDPAKFLTVACQISGQLVQF